MNQKRIILALLLLLTPMCRLLAQKAEKPIPPTFPNGWHIGITGEVNLAQRMSVIPLVTGDAPAPRAKPWVGGRGGIEFSYHFAKYFGVSIGLDYGTTTQYNIFCWKTNPRGYDFTVPSYFSRFQMPIKLEFHYPFQNSNFSLFCAAGVNLVDVLQSIIYNSGYQNIPGGEGMFCWIYVWGDAQSEYHHKVYDDNGHKLKVDMQLNLGAYYRLPYNDLLRMSLCANIAFRDKAQGYYVYHTPKPSSGALCYRHNYLGLEVAYIHCFKPHKKRVATTVNNE